MSQRFLTYAVSRDAERAAATDALERAGFAVSDARRMVPGIQIRVRDETTDAEVAAGIVAKLAPTATPMPGGAPTTVIPDYRKGH